MRRNFNQLTNSVAIFEGSGIPKVIAPRVTRLSLNQELERAAIKHAGEEEMNRMLHSINDETAKSGKYTGDTWGVAFLLKELCAGDPDFPEINKKETTEAEIRRRLYSGPVLMNLKVHRKQRVAAYEEAQRIAARESIKEDADFAVSGE